ncbi:ATP-binding protein [Streptomyces sp. BA2]|uniref:ATP-binding protein n=1 Tax=Streptomyces sp. BA2 TaxID=436595 RepID=UPI0013269605|nr:ATP-binding protein [Streptomyces sp. BA2]MWA13168.1 ATP-binding protein [Streptomyces sp. BA2]
MVTVTVSPPTIPNWPAPEVWSYALHLPHDPRAPRIARQTLRAVLSGYGLGELTDAAELLTSELVTNAYRHTRGPAALRLRGLGGGRGVRVGVWDTDPHIPPPFSRTPTGLPPLAEEAEGGRGLRLVAEWATAWGGFPLGDDLFGQRGKVLWVECRYAAPRGLRCTGG